MSTRVARPARRPLLRVRTGCLTCRARKKKCDEGKPKCRGCIRNELDCQWPPEQQPKPSCQVVNRGSISSERESGSGSGSGSGSSSGTPPQNEEDTEELARDESPPQQQRTPHQSPWDITDTLLEHFGTPFFDLTDGLPVAEDHPAATPEAAATEAPGSPLRPSTSALELNEVIPAQPSFMPQLDQTRFSLFGHYIENTARSMANGATTSNPFLVQLLPLSVSSGLVLESILSQSCAHRSARAPMITESESFSYYSTSLRSIRTAIETFSSQTKEDVLSLVVSMLILCFTETARGDTTGCIFFHLQAISFILPGALLKLKNSIPSDLRNFLLEYYLYTSTLSLISIDADSHPETIICLELLQEGHDLAVSGYIGNLCGCWLEIIMLIPHVFDLGSKWKSQTPDITADQVMSFSLLESQISNWKPNHVDHDVAIVGKVYQQALLLYLINILDKPSYEESSLHAMRIQEITSEAMLLLDRFSATKQINTSLCWPLTVVGSCALHPQQQEIIQARLETMVPTIGLGNMLKTKELLEYIWSQGPKGPWEIAKAMQTSGLWISFA